MPELPEVEVVRLSLQRSLPRRLIEKVSVHSPSLREPLDARRLRWLAGQRVTKLNRRAKYLLIEVEDGTLLVVHLGMSGRLTVVADEEPIAKHEHVAFHLESGRRLRLVDPRRFGLVFTVPHGGIEEDPHFVHLGVEPLGEDLSGAYLKEQATGRRGPIKNFLMDGRIVVGVGNIYACEVLWRTGIHPKRSVARVARKTWTRIAEAIQEVLGDAIRQGGTTLNDFQDGEGNAGYFQVSLAVYGRENEACPRCEGTIRRRVQAGRGTFYCAGCQH